MASSSSTSNQYGATAAPPPTPSTQPNLFSTSDAAADSLSRLLHRHLPPILSPPSRRKSPTSITSLPTLSLLDPQLSLSSKLLSASQLGFFQLTDHSISSQLAHSAESESHSLFHLPTDQKKLFFPQNWPLGYDGDNDDDDENEGGDSFCVDSLCSSESADLSLTSLREFTIEMEKIGLTVIEALSCAVGFENPLRADSSRVNSLMWISEDSPGNKTVSPGKIYPYAVGLHYQIRRRKLSMLSDSGWVSVLPQVDSILVTLGDIAQVWSNGKLKKVRGRPVPCSVEGDHNTAQSITMSLLVSLPLDSIVSPLLIPTTAIVGDEIEIKEDEECDNNPKAAEESVLLFNSFSFEDYAWRVYHERLIFKDPLDRYRA